MTTMDTTNEQDDTKAEKLRAQMLRLRERLDASTMLGELRGCADDLYALCDRAITCFANEAEYAEDKSAMVQGLEGEFEALRKAHDQIKPDDRVHLYSGSVVMTVGTILGNDPGAQVAEVWWCHSGTGQYDPKCARIPVAALKRAPDGVPTRQREPSND